MHKKKIAIIGTGITGLSAAWHLRNKYQIVFFEQNEYFGGHTNTVKVKTKDNELFFDTGFITYNNVTYPGLTKFFEEINLATQPTDMSLSVKSSTKDYEWSSKAIFGQCSNLFNINHWRMIKDVIRFNHLANSLIKNKKLAAYENQVTLQIFIEKYKLSQVFLDYYLIPMVAAIWSTPYELVRNFPIKMLIEFLDKHKFLSLFPPIKWRTVTGGSKSYIEAALKHIDYILHLNCAIRTVIEQEEKVILIDKSNNQHIFDQVIIATHADQALNMLSSPNNEQLNLLSNFKYEKNTVIVHCDSNFMPSRKPLWSSWNYHSQTSNLISATYWLNNLQGFLPKNDHIFVTLNPTETVAPEKLYLNLVYEHPLSDINSFNAQQHLNIRLGSKRLAFCGSYFKYGFHEDAFQAGKQAALVICQI